MSRLVRSISGTWHLWSKNVEDDFDDVYALTKCNRMVIPGKYLDWDGKRFPGRKVCCDCSWYADVV